VSSSWQPANEVERLMAEALTRGDTAEYFRTFAVATLALPTLLADHEEGQAQRMVTWDIDGETFLPVFTSVEALTECLDESCDAFSTVTYRELAEKWPEPSWRLAINPGSPIGAFVDVATVIEAALERVRVPAPESPADLFEAGVELAEDVDDHDLLLDTLLLSTVLLPVTKEVPAGAIEQSDFPWRVTEDQPMATISVFTSEEQMAADMSGPVPVVEVDLIDVLLAWPDPSYRLVVNPGSGLQMTFDGGDVPALIACCDDLIERYSTDKSQG